MPQPKFAPCPPDEVLLAGFQRVRDELDVPTGFRPEVLAEAEAAAAAGPTLPPGADTEPTDRRELELVSIDPPGSRDLDQAFTALRKRGRYRVYYAIADPASFVAPGGAVDLEARRRGVTLYSPDRRTSLHPEVLSEGAASLLPGEDRPAILWTIDLDRDGSIAETHVERSMVRNRAALSYGEAQGRLAETDAPKALRLLREIGRLRQEQERLRGAVSLQLPAQEIRCDDDGYQLHYEQSLPVESWNAQISLLTGIAAAAIMIEAGEGILRTLPPAGENEVDRLRRVARGLHVGWADSVSYAERVRELDPNIPNEAALLAAAASGLRGAGYEAFHDGQIPDEPEHSAIASTYAHVTAPLRRLCDRFANEVLLAAVAGRPTPDWAAEALDELPAIMNEARARDRRLERAQLDFMEAVVLADRVGDEFEAVVTAARDGESTVQLEEPAVITRLDLDLELGDHVELRLVAVDPASRSIEFEPIDP